MSNILNIINKSISSQIQNTFQKEIHILRNYSDFYSLLTNKVYFISHPKNAYIKYHSYSLKWISQHSKNLKIENYLQKMKYSTFNNSIALNSKYNLYQNVTSNEKPLFILNEKLKLLKNFRNFSNDNNNSNSESESEMESKKDLIEKESTTTISKEELNKNENQQAFHTNKAFHKGIINFLKANKTLENNGNRPWRHSEISDSKSVNDQNSDKKIDELKNNYKENRNVVNEFIAQIKPSSEVDMIKLRKNDEEKRCDMIDLEKLMKDEEKEHGNLKEPMGELPAYIEWEGGKLANRTYHIEVSIDELRVDTRETVIKKRKYLKMRDNPENNTTTSLNDEEEIETEEDIYKNLKLPMIENINYKAIVLILVGAQGSGKSKFASDLVEHASVPWIRINQDTVRHGRRGTKSDCVEKMKDLLEKGYCVVLDRMNYTEEQRKDFVEAAKLVKCETHALIFRLPFVENVYNVAKRTNHEGNFEGTSELHRRIIFSTRSKLFNGGHPRNTRESLRSIFECKSNEDYAFAFRQWVNYGRVLKNGDRLTLEQWLEYHGQWRLKDNDMDKLEETVHQIRDDIKNTLENKYTPTRHGRVNMEEETTWQERTMGYLPSRDGPVEDI